MILNQRKWGDVHQLCDEKKWQALKWDQAPSRVGMNLRGYHGTCRQKSHKFSPKELLYGLQSLTDLAIIDH